MGKYEFSLPRMTVAEILEDLRDSADELGDLVGIKREEMHEYQGAQTIEEMQGALQKILDGVGDPKAVAAEGLSLQAPLRRGQGAESTIVQLLKPHRG